MLQPQEGLWTNKCLLFTTNLVEVEGSRQEKWNLFFRPFQCRALRGARASQDWFPIYRFVVMILFKLADSISDIIKISQRRLCIQQPASELTYNWDGGWLQDCNMIIFQTQEASSPLIGFIYASRFHLPIALPLASNNFLRSQFSNCQFWHLNLDRIQFYPL